MHNTPVAVVAALGTMLNTSVVPHDQHCDHCGGVAERIISTPFVRLSKASKLEKLDPKYDKLVDRAMRSTPLADPDRLLKKMKPFDKPPD